MNSSPHWHQAPSLPSLMWQVQMALWPAMLWLSLQQGFRWLANWLYALLLAMLLEALCLALRGKNIRSALDGSIALSACLLVLALPLAAPLWLLSVAVTVTVLFGKQLYGGLGMNPFNPAMVGFVFCLLAFPAAMGQHSAEALPWVSLFQPVDALSAATLLDEARQARLEKLPVTAVIAAETYVLHGLYLAGALYLAWRRLLDFRLVLAVLGSAWLTAWVFHGLNPQLLTPWQHWHSGALILGACFIATDPVSAATTVGGRWLYGALIGSLTIAIRCLGQFPDGLALAVLLANACAPFLDALTKPRYR